MDWLPELICCDGEWHEIERILYAQFKRDFLDREARFQGLSVRMRYVEGDHRRETAFWHLISEGDIEEQRIPDFRRCERIGWIRAILDHADDRELMIWEQERNGKINTVVALPDFSYIVFLGRRQREGGDRYLLLLTAYYVAKQGKRDRYRRECEEYHRNKRR